jgi:hypothetical protein
MRLSQAGRERNLQLAEQHVKKRWVGERTLALM